jgi:hypothetical protein
MADRPDRILRLVARVLPREFRERVVEPALADLRIAGTGAQNCLGTALFLGECLRIGLPQHFWRRGRPTRFGVTVVCALVLIVFVTMRLRYAPAWRAEATRAATPSADRAR